MYRVVKDFTVGEKDRFEKYYKGFEYVGILMEDSRAIPILKGSWTPFGCARDMGKYWIIARYDRYDRVTKVRNFIKYDVEDK